MSMCHRISWTISLAMLFAFGLVGCSEKRGGTTGGAAASRTTLEGVEGCEGAILPDAKTIETGTYKPLSRPLFIYVNSKALQKPEVAGYVKTLLNQAQEQVEHAGFVKLNPTVLKAQQDKLAEAIGKLEIPEKVEGTISVDGSSTVQPFSTIAAEIFEKANDKKVRVQVGSKGTGGGMERFCVGETDICNASRIMKPSEAAKAKSNGIEYTEFTICIDGISVCVSAKNDWCDCLSVEQLKALWEPESKVKLWSDLNPKWPKTEIKLYGPDTDSGTYDYFNEVIVGAKSSRSDYTPSSADTILVKGIAGDKNSLGYFGFSYYDQNRESLKALGIKPAAAKADKAKAVAEKKPAEEKKSAESKPDAEKAAEPAKAGEK